MRGFVDVDVRVSHARCTLPSLVLLVYPTFTSRTKEWQSRPLVCQSSPLKLALHSRRPSAEYTPNDNEILESENLEIIGEDSGNGSLRTGTIPVRTLTGFSVFAVETGHLVSLGSLLAPRDSPHLASFCVAGYVLPAMENAVDDAEESFDLDLEDCQYLRLSPIRFMNLFNLDEDQKALDRYYLML